jgi:hypothetical protein
VRHRAHTDAQNVRIFRAPAAAAERNQQEAQ